MSENTTPTIKPWNDFRDDTTGERLTIGFSGLKDAWRAAEAVQTGDALTICGHPVMERWENEYMRDLASIATMRGGRVLEVGFGLGISAAFIQQHPIREHVIIEANREVFIAAEVFAKAAPSPAHVLFGFWEEVVPDLPDGYFQGILFDTYPLTAEEVHRNHFPFFKEAHRLLGPDGVLTYYSDEIEDFSPEHLARLQEAGFRSIGSRPCHVDPPQECKYWRAKTILSPIIVK